MGNWSNIEEKDYLFQVDRAEKAEARVAELEAERHATKPLGPAGERLLARVAELEAMLEKDGETYYEACTLRARVTQLEATILAVRKAIGGRSDGTAWAVGRALDSVCEEKTSTGGESHKPVETSRAAATPIGAEPGVPFAGPVEPRGAALKGETDTSVSAAPPASNGPDQTDPTLLSDGRLTPRARAEIGLCPSDPLPGPCGETFTALLTPRTDPYTFVCDLRAGHMGMHATREGVAFQNAQRTNEEVIPKGTFACSACGQPIRGGDRGKCARCGWEHESRPRTNEASAPKHGYSLSEGVPMARPTEPLPEEIASPCAECGATDAPYRESRCMLHYGGQTKGDNRPDPTEATPVTMPFTSHQRLVRERDQAIELLVRLGHPEAAQRIIGSDPCTDYPLPKDLYGTECPHAEVCNGCTSLADVEVLKRQARDEEREKWYVKARVYGAIAAEYQRALEKIRDGIGVTASHVAAREALNWRHSENGGVPIKAVEAIDALLRGEARPETASPEPLACDVCGQSEDEGIGRTVDVCKHCYSVAVEPHPAVAMVVSTPKLRTWLARLEESCAAPDFKGVEDVRYELRAMLTGGGDT